MGKCNMREVGRPSWKLQYAKQSVKTTYRQGRGMSIKKKRQYRKLPALCQHCGKVCILRPRQLCWTCYYDPFIAKKYADANHWSKVAKLEHSGKLPPLPDSPTNARPGSEAKILVLQGRAERGEQLFHPQDF